MVGFPPSHISFPGCISLTKKILQVFMEYQLANWLKKGNWDDLPFNAGKIRHYNSLEEPPKSLDSR